MPTSDWFSQSRFLITLPALGIVLALGGCAANPPLAPTSVAAPPQWYASLPKVGAVAEPPSSTEAPANSLPHNGQLSNLSQWWQQQNDALLVDMISAAQIVSPSVISARANIQQAQASRSVSAAALLPRLDVAGGFNRGVSEPSQPNAPAAINNAAQLGLQTSWEIDLFGKNLASLNADSERLLGSQARWHEARILVAAEVASQYYSLRACEQLLGVVRDDAASRRQTQRLTDLLTHAGLSAPATAALARATAAEGNNRITQQRAECDMSIKALVALTGWSEPTLRQKLAQSAAPAPQQGMANIASVPADVLAQRPDVYNAARALNAASFDVGSARAQRYVRLSIGGSIMANRFNSAGSTQAFNTWSIGPVALTLPLFDGGAAQANVNAATARYEEAAGKYQGVVRQAVREVEEALVTLQSAADRGTDTQVAADGYRASFAGTQARYKAGLASLLELEEARRMLLAAQSAEVLLERERRNAWIGLYKALGGGWHSDAPPPTAMNSGTPDTLLAD